MTRLCLRCNKNPAYEDEDFCAICLEHKLMVSRENGLTCQHCGQAFTEKEFDRHATRIYYRLGEFPKAQRRH